MEVKQSRSAAETIAPRQRNSGGVEADKTIKTGEGERRTFHNVHLSGYQAQHGQSRPGEGDIFNQPRGPADQGANR